MYNPTSDTQNYIKEGMMLEKCSWSDEDGKGDALWRTALAYIAYGEPALKEAIIKCFRKFTMINKKGYLYQGSRAWDRFREDDFSRDQLIMALASLKFNGDEDELREISEHLPTKISRRFRSTLSLRLWMKAVTRGGRWNAFAYHLVELLGLAPSILLNKIIRPLIGKSKSYDLDWYTDYDFTTGFWHYEDGKWVWIYEPNNYHWVTNSHKLYNENQRKEQSSSFLRMVSGMMFPPYALHLTSWLLHTSPHSFLKKLLQKLVTWETEDSNYLIQLLMENQVDSVDVNTYQPVDGTRWSTRLDGRSYFKKLEGDDALYNTLDRDALLKIYQKN